MYFSEKEIFKLPEDSTSIFKINMIDLHIYCPDSVFRQKKFSILNYFCFAEFLRYYYIVSNNENEENDYRRKGLQIKLWNLINE